MITPHHTMTEPRHVKTTPQYIMMKPHNVMTKPQYITTQLKYKVTKLHHITIKHHHLQITDYIRKLWLSIVAHRTCSVSIESQSFMSYVAEWSSKVELQTISRIPEALWSQQMYQESLWVLLVSTRVDWRVYTSLVAEETAIFQGYLALQIPL